MRVAYLIAGAGGMYCGSCMRDNRVAATLIDRGHDVVLMPLYTPIRTDEIDVSRLPVHYGGISLYLSQKSAAFRRLPGFVKRWMDAPTLLSLASRWAVKTDGADLGALTLAMLQSESAVHDRHLERLVADLRTIDPDVVHLPNLLFVGIAGPLREALDVPVVCTMAGEDVFLDALPTVHREQASALIRRAAAEVDGFISPTRYYAAAMVERFGVPDDRVHHVPLGIHCEEAQPTSAAQSGPFVIGYLARIAPEKGLTELGDAFVELRRQGRDCRLRAAGYLAANQTPYVDRLRQRLAAAGCAQRFDFLGEVDRAGKLDLLRGVHCLAAPTPYPEAKGLYVLEALMAGVPVVLPRRGAFTELVEATAGGVLHEPDSTAALASAIAGLMDDPERRVRLGQRGREAVCKQFTADVMADAAWEVFQRYART